MLNFLFNIKNLQFNLYFKETRQTKLETTKLAIRTSNINFFILITILCPKMFKRL